MKVNKQTFFFLCETLGPFLKKFHILMIASVDVEIGVVVILAKLANDNTLSMVRDLYTRRILVHSDHGINDFMS